MPMMNHGGYADVIEKERLKELVPDAYQSFMDAIENTPNAEFEETAEWLELEWNEFDDTKPTKDEMAEVDYGMLIIPAWIHLKKSFHEKTEGLTLYTIFLSDDTDGLKGAWFTVDGMYEMTPAGKKHQFIISREFFSTFG